MKLIKKNEEINNPKEEKAFASLNEAYSSGRVPGIVKRGLTDVYYPPIESAKGTISSVGDKFKNAYDIMSSAESARNWIPSLKAAGWIALGAGVTGCSAYIAANRGFTVADNSSIAVGNFTNSTKSGAAISNLSSTCPRLTMQSQID
ncbi:hypothetical protein HET73_03805 [Wolbachia endosymbiont of Atemnus politus]|uniref:hypothetical protein n=1 Tax=Wolbachia endosymbiont of Atemnus politus TaxID=2682840 RepID=UPI0015722F17|nr:hypothetical protein [Wolbachia endosymbiont of Atemnus politus]NSM56604.1 hypothetical protein [Wolbachia endosymbiont of Atemnus politus]